jgi:hypothetical protein
MRAPLHDLACVVHVHSTYSDGTGTVRQIAAAAARARVDAVLLTDHDTLEARRRGEERRFGSVLVCVGEEVSPRGGHHLLAFGIEEEIRHRGLRPAQLTEAVRDAGGVSFLAHPFSRGSERFRRLGDGMPWDDPFDGAHDGIELWSFVTDTAERLASIPQALAFIASPGRVVDHPPAPNVAAWDAMCARRPTVAIGGIDAHQVGWRVAGHVPVRLMAYHRSFRHLRTHALVERAPGDERDAARDRDAVYAALRAGRCYLAMDSLAPARGFHFGAEGPAGPVEQGSRGEARGAVIHVRLPRIAALTLRRDGATIVSRHAAGLDHQVTEPGVYRLEARLAARGRMRTWVMSNPLYLD